MLDTITLVGLEHLADTIIFQLDHQLISSQSEGNDYSGLTKNIITIGLALMAGMLALYQVKANIISSARIKWIEQLKDSTSKFCVYVEDTRLILHRINHECSEAKDEEEKRAIIYNRYDEYKTKAVLVTQMGLLIKLNLNTTEPNHKKIEELIDQLEKELRRLNLNEINDSKIESSIKDLVDTSKLVYKSEWEQSKGIFRF